MPLGDEGEGRDFFPTLYLPVVALGETHAYQARHKRETYSTMEEVVEAQSRAIDRALRYGEPRTISTGWVSDPLLLNVKDARVHHAVIAGQSDELKREADRLIRHLKQSHFSTLGKVLAQRQLHVLMSMIHHVSIAVSESGRDTSALNEVSARLRVARDLVLVSESDLRQLRQRRDFISCGDPTRQRHDPWDLTSDYTPAFAQDMRHPDWQRIQFGTATPEHLDRFEGRNFIRVGMRVPSMNHDQFMAYWANIYGKYGARLTTSGGVPPLPARSETVLLRTIGVVTTDYDYVDSEVPEEVLVRAFLKQKPELNLASSDYQGTFAFQYKLASDPLNLPTEIQQLKLKRIPDDGAVFSGFLTEVPDRVVSASSNLTTMRSNCIACHSELYYGINTIHSLAFPPHSQADDLQSSQYLQFRRKGAYTLVLPAEVPTRTK